MCFTHLALKLVKYGKVLFPVRLWIIGFTAVALNEKSLNVLNGTKELDWGVLSSLSSAAARNHALNVHSLLPCL